MEAKACSKCGATKYLSQFYTNKTATDGRQSQCKACHRVTSRDSRRRLADPGQIPRCSECREPLIREYWTYCPNCGKDLYA